MGYDPNTAMWTPDNPDGSKTGSSAAGAVSPSGGGLLKPNGNTSSVIGNVNADLSAGGDYIHAAEAAGADYANSRGVLNSSIGAGASRKAAYDAVTPIATADAANVTQKDLSAQGFQQSTALQKQQGDIQSGLQASQIAGQKDITGMQTGSAERIAQLGAATQTALNQMNIDAASKQQAAQIVAQLQMSGDQIQAQRDIAALNISDADKQQLNAIAANQTLAKIQQDTQLQVANMNVVSDQQDKAMAAATQYAAVYATEINAINGNTQIPADARATALANAKTMYDNNMKVVEQTYNVSLDWGQGPLSDASSSAPVDSTTPAADAQQPQSDELPGAETRGQQ